MTVEGTANPNPKPASTEQQAIPPQAPVPPPPQNKKRNFDDVDVQDSKYFKICALVKELRPHFIEVIRTPDFRNCNAAHEIRKKMKLVMDLYKQMTVETVSIGRCQNSSDCQPLSGEHKGEPKRRERHQEEKQMGPPRPDRVLEKSSEDKHPLPGNISEKKPEEDKVHATYVVGGSACGWNFVMYPRSKTVYYGVTKETHRLKK